MISTYTSSLTNFGENFEIPFDMVISNGCLNSFEFMTRFKVRHPMYVYAWYNHIYF